MDCRNVLDYELQFLADLSDDELEALFDVASTAAQGSSIFTGLTAEVVGASSQAIIGREPLLESIAELNACRVHQRSIAKGALVGGAVLGTTGAIGGYLFSQRNSSWAATIGVASAALGLLVGGAVMSRRA